ncbi:MAG TPA: hypothetical protein VF638_04455 [Sphingomonas sp.]|jgi:hypothetical protein
MTVTANQLFTAALPTVTTRAEDQFFADLKTSNRTFKRTASDRFVDLDTCCLRRFKQSYSQIRTVLDIGISSGSTTLALHDRLVAAGYAPKTTGTDLSFSSWLVPIRAGIRTLIDESGHPLQHDVLGMAVRPWRRRADYVTGMVLVRRWLNKLCERAVAERKMPDPNAVPVRLLSRRLQERTDIDVEISDIFEPAPHMAGKFDFIRAANVLNLGYFNATRIQAGLTNLLDYLSGPGAWLLVGRSGKRGHHATLFRLSSDGRRLQIVERIGTGSEVEHLVLRAMTLRSSAT